MLATVSIAQSQIYVGVPLGFQLGDRQCFAQDINNIGQIVGYTEDTSGPAHAFLWQNGTMTYLPFQGEDGETTVANGVNDLGQVVGGAWPRPTGGSSAVLWQNGSVTDLSQYLPSLGGPTAKAISESGVVVGSAGGVQQAYALFNQCFVGLGTLGGSNSEATDVNSGGTVVGWAHDSADRQRAFAWQDRDGDFVLDLGEMIDLGTLGGDESFAYAVNDSGQVVGWSTDSAGIRHAFIWEDSNGNGLSDSGEMSDLGPGWAQDINNRGQVVGCSPAAAFVYENGTTQHLFVDGMGWASLATGINDSGMIAALFWDADEQSYWSGALVPVPEPSSTLTLVGGLGCLATALKRRRCPR